MTGLIENGISRPEVDTVVEAERSGQSWVLSQAFRAEDQKLILASNKAKVSDPSHCTPELILEAAKKDTDYHDYGLRPISGAHRGFLVKPSVMCAFRTSRWIQTCDPTMRDHVRVSEIVPDLLRRSYKAVPLRGSLDPSAFPPGIIGFIVGQGRTNDDLDDAGSNHIALVRKRDDGQIEISHNVKGKIVHENIVPKFYQEDGSPNYARTRLLLFPKSYNQR